MGGAVAGDGSVTQLPWHWCFTEMSRALREIVFADTLHHDPVEIDLWNLQSGNALAVRDWRGVGGNRDGGGSGNCRLSG